MSLALLRCKQNDLLGANFILKSLLGITNTQTLLVSPTKASVNFAWLKTHLKLILGAGLAQAGWLGLELAKQTWNFGV